VFVVPPRGWYDAPPPSVEVLRGDPIVELTRRARLGDVRMVVVGAGRPGPWSSRSATALAHAARVPVVLVPATAMPRARAVRFSLAPSAALTTRRTA
jgi:nucleotide-binding universal stress UspA family protein